MYASGSDTREPTSKKPKDSPPPPYRSSCVKTSLGSDSSRIRLIEYDAELEPRVDAAYGTICSTKVFTRLDHVLAIFGIHKEGRVITPTKAQAERRHLSPWVLPVYVLSSQKDESRHFIPKEAKCTIDTGNFQGNIVSKAFVTDVLRFPESLFQSLTKLEEAGGTGVTGHKLIPEGAIYLTWYYGNSTRVFRDMRFLISEHPMYDLIIGSQSIHENRILDVPNLGDEPAGPIVISDSDEKIGEVLAGFRKEVNLAEKKAATFRTNLDIQGSNAAGEKRYVQFQENAATCLKNFQNKSAEQRGELEKIWADEAKPDGKIIQQVRHTWTEKWVVKQFPAPPPGYVGKGA